MATKQIIIIVCIFLLLLSIMVRLLFFKQKIQVKLIVLDGVSSVGKSSIARSFMNLQPDMYILIGINDFVSPVFLEQQKNPLPFELFMKRIDTCNEQMFKKIRELVLHGKPVVLDTVMAGLRGIEGIEQDISAMKGLDKTLVLIHVPLSMLIQRITERNKRAQEQHNPQDSRSLVLTLRQLSATYKERCAGSEIDLGIVTRQELEHACLLAKDEFGDNAHAYRQFTQEVLSNLGLTNKEKITITTRVHYDLVINAEHTRPEESAITISNFVTMKYNSKVVKSGYIELYTEHFGKQSNPAVLLISGAMASARFWADSFCRHIADHGYFVIRYDHRDMGRSSAIDYTKNPYTLKDLEKDTIAILDAYKISKAHLVGHSMGGTTAQLVALDYPTRVLSIAPISSAAIANAPLHDNEKAILERTWPILMRNKPTKNFEKSFDGFMHSYEFLHGDIPMDKELAKRYIYDMYVRSKPEHIAWFEKFSSGAEPMHNHVKAQQAMPNRASELKNLKIPVLVIHGSKDCLSFPRIMKEYCVNLVPHATMHEINGMGHMVLNEDLWGEIEKLLTDFWGK